MPNRRPKSHVKSTGRLWAPWRYAFIRRGKPAECIFCEKSRSKKDSKNLVLDRGRRVFSLLNLYPYNNGHVMVAPYRHISDVADMGSEEAAELFEFIQSLTRRLKKTVKAHGFNIGLNVSHDAGAGFAHHLHWHIVPRWSGDNNFMPVVAGTRVISQSLEEMYRLLKKHK